MALFDRILVPVDFSDGSRMALDHAVWLARTHGGVVFVLHVLETGHTLALHAAHEDTAAADLERAVPEEYADVVKDRKLVKASCADMAIAHEGRERDATLMVMATHGRSGLRHMFMGSVAEKVVRTAHRPVLTLRERPPLDRGLHRILVPLDFSEAGHSAMMHATEAVAGIEGAEIHLVHVVSPMPHPVTFGAAAPVWADYEVVAREAAEKGLAQRVKAMAEQGYTVTSEVLAGAPAAALVQAAEERGSDLIVMATHGLTGFEHAMLGSVAERVVRTSRVAVLTVKP